MKRFRIEAPAAIYFNVDASTEEEAKERAADLIDAHADLDGYAFDITKKTGAQVFFNEDITAEDLEIVAENEEDDDEDQTDSDDDGDD